MSNEQQPQSSSYNQDDSEERAQMEFMKRQLEISKRQLKEATTTHGKFDSMTEILALQEGMSLEEARARALEMQEKSFGIAFEDGTVETTRRRDQGPQNMAVEEVSSVPSHVSVREPAAEIVPQGENDVGQSSPSVADDDPVVAAKETAMAAAAMELHPEALPWLLSNGVPLFRDAEQPFVGFEDELLNLTARSDQYAWLRAFSFFPQLSGLSSDLLRAYVRSNLCQYTRNKLIDDYLVSTGQHARHDVPLGFSQITSAKVLDLEQRYPPIAAFFAGAGYIGAAHESLVLLDPSCMPIVVASYVASLADELSEHGIDVNDWTVAYSFSPDVYAHTDSANKTVYEVLEGLDISLSKVKHWDQHLEVFAENDEIISQSKQVKKLVAQLMHLSSL